MSILALESNNDLSLLEGQLVLQTDAGEEAATFLQGAFQIVLGEWFADTRIGVPYFGVVLVKNPDIGVVRQLFRAVILSAPRVVDVLKLEITLNKRTRRADFVFRALADSGQVITGGTGVPFIVEVT